MAKSKVEGVAKVTAALKGLTARGASVKVIVGFTAGYALYVHENLEAFHPVGQAKFLEQPARQLAPRMVRMAAEAMKNKATLEQALLKGGLLLQRESQKLVPVDTGALKNSAFTRTEK